MVHVYPALQWNDIFKFHTLNGLILYDGPLHYTIDLVRMRVGGIQSTWTDTSCHQ